MKRLKVIACEVAFRELCFYASRSKSVIDFTFMPRRLHVVGSVEMREALQEEINKVEVEKYDAILLGYGLCGCGIVGVRSELPIVLPKIYDCISFFLGSAERYAELQREYPKGFYFTSGWLEREIVPGSDHTSEKFTSYKSMIDDVIFVNTGVGDEEAYREVVRGIATNVEAHMTEITGDPSLLVKFLNREWNQNEFIMIPPKCTIVATGDDNVIGYQE